MCKLGKLTKLDGKVFKQLLTKMKESYSKDPVRKCIIYKNSGCSHVDGMLCDFDTCKERLEAELFELEQQLDIPKELRYYNRKK